MREQAFPQPDPPSCRRKGRTPWRPTRQDQRSVFRVGAFIANGPTSDQDRLRITPADRIGAGFDAVGAIRGSVVRFLGGSRWGSVLPRARPLTAALGEDNPPRTRLLSYSRLSSGVSFGVKLFSLKRLREDNWVCPQPPLSLILGRVTESP